MGGMSNQCQEAHMDYCPLWIRLCEKNKWFEKDEMGWVTNKGVELQLTPLLYI